MFLGVLVVYFLRAVLVAVRRQHQGRRRPVQRHRGACGSTTTSHLCDNLRQLFTYNDGIYLRWIGNSLLYAVAGGVGATVLAVLAGYGFAKYRFRGRDFTLRDPARLGHGAR